MKSPRQISRECERAREWHQHAASATEQKPASRGASSLVAGTAADANRQKQEHADAVLQEEGAPTSGTRA